MVGAEVADQRPEEENRVSNAPSNRPTLTLTGLESLRLLSAFQALQMPEGFYGATYAQCEAIIEDMTGKPVEGRPTHVRGGLEAFLSWHLGAPVVGGPVVTIAEGRDEG